MIESVSWRVYVLRGIGIVGGMLEIITFLGRDLIDDSLSCYWRSSEKRSKICPLVQADWRMTSMLQNSSYSYYTRQAIEQADEHGNQYTSNGRIR